LQEVRDEDGLVVAALLELDALDERDADGALGEGALHLWHNRSQEVVRDDEDLEAGRAGEFDFLKKLEEREGKKEEGRKLVREGGEGVRGEGRRQA
jgi:hypothetical protein